MMSVLLNDVMVWSMPGWVVRQASVKIHITGKVVGMTPTRR